jgi:hypothetical protein
MKNQLPLCDPNAVAYKFLFSLFTVQRTALHRFPSKLQQVGSIYLFLTFIGYFNFSIL